MAAPCPHRQCNLVNNTSCKLSHMLKIQEETRGQELLSAVKQEDRLLLSVLLKHVGVNPNYVVRKQDSCAERCNQIIEGICSCESSMATNVEFAQASDANSFLLRCAKLIPHLRDVCDVCAEYLHVHRDESYTLMSCIERHYARKVYTPLLAAAESNNFPIMEMLLKAGADMHFDCGCYSGHLRNPLPYMLPHFSAAMLPVVYQDTRMLTFLLQHGLNVNRLSQVSVGHASEVMLRTLLDKCIGRQLLYHPFYTSTKCENLAWNACDMGGFCLPPKSQRNLQHMCRMVVRKLVATCRCKTHRGVCTCTNMFALVQHSMPNLPTHLKKYVLFDL